MLNKQSLYMHTVHLVAILHKVHIVILYKTAVTNSVDLQPLVIVARLLNRQSLHKTVVPDAGVRIYDVRAQSRVDDFRYELRVALLRV